MEMSSTRASWQAVAMSLEDMSQPATCHTKRSLQGGLGGHGEFEEEFSGTSE